MPTPMSLWVTRSDKNTVSYDVGFLRSVVRLSLHKSVVIFRRQDSQNMIQVYFNDNNFLNVFDF